MKTRLLAVSFAIHSAVAAGLWTKNFWAGACVLCALMMFATLFFAGNDDGDLL